jgi:hypothetical protein
VLHRHNKSGFYTGNGPRRRNLVPCCLLGSLVNVKFKVAFVTMTVKI